MSIQVSVGILTLLLGTSVTVYRARALTMQASTEQSVLSPSELFQRVNAAVVVVEAIDERGSRRSQGSGVIVAPSIVVTNKHVVTYGDAIRVSRGRESWEASVAALDPEADLCLLLVIGLEASDISIRASSNLQIGERVFAIGAPQGFELTLSDGLVSGIRKKKKSTEVDVNAVADLLTTPDSPTKLEAVASTLKKNGEMLLIQTTAAISPGSSGGGLFDEKGNLVGIMTFSIEGAQGLNFALPAEMWASLASQTTGGTALAWMNAGDTLVEDARRGLSLRQLPLPGADVSISDSRAMQALGRKAEESMKIYRADMARAIRPYRECLRLAPANALAWVRLGEVYSSIDDRESTGRAFRKALELRPGDAWVWHQFAETLGRLQDYEEAGNAYRVALRLQPSVSLWLDLANTARRYNREEALDALAQAAQLSPRPWDWNRIGGIYAELGKKKEAQAAYEESVRLEPNDELLLFDLGRFYVSAGRKRQAREIYERLRIVDPQRAALLREFM